MEIVTDRAFAAIALATLVMLVFWPERVKGPVEDYLRILSPVYWKEESEIYEEILKLHPMFGLQEHNKMLSYLFSKKRVERRIEFPHTVEEIESPNRFGRTYVDHAEPFGVISAVRYRLVPRRGGRGRRVRLFQHVPA